MQPNPQSEDVTNKPKITPTLGIYKVLTSFNEDSVGMISRHFTNNSRNAGNPEICNHMH